MGKLYLLA